MELVRQILEIFLVVIFIYIFKIFIFFLLQEIKKDRKKTLKKFGKKHNKIMNHRKVTKSGASMMPSAALFFVKNRIPIL